MVSVYEIIEIARKTGKIEKGANETTKAVELGTAKLVAYGADVDPKEIVQHLPIIAKEKGITCVEADSKKKLGIAVGIGVGCSAVAIVDAGEAEKDLASFKKSAK
ncbi:50S ribosomal protein L7ae [Candidatus Pacearchaeota archaeon]|nr:50S ribosomal protein L7ae [Candidatus Pacearchaeota archaeon]